MKASESIYMARGAESGAAESEGQPMYRTPLGSALVANWQYLILASGPRSCDLDPLGLEDKSWEQKLGQMRSLSSGDRSPERNNEHSRLWEGGCHIPPSSKRIILKLSISAEATRFPPTQPGAVALA